MVTRLDRLARSTATCSTPSTSHQARRRLQVAGRYLGRHHNGAGRLMLTILGGLAEFERELIRARTGEGRPS